MRNIILLSVSLLLLEPVIYHLIQQTLYYIRYNNTIIFYCYFFILNHLLFSIIDEDHHAKKNTVLALSVSFIYFIVNLFLPRINYLAYHTICISLVIMLWITSGIA
jgi:hypothetical protein